MRRWVRAGYVMSFGFTGCAAVPPIDNPGLVQPQSSGVENPLLVAPGLPTPDGYAMVYDRTLDALDDYFEIKPGSRYSGYIETKPRNAPGFEQFFKPGSPDGYQRLLATMQSIRHYAIVRIAASERGGFRVYVEVYRELEDTSRPSAAISGDAAFIQPAAVAPRREALLSVAKEPTWIPDGRDAAFEQAILKKIRTRCR